MKTTIEVTLRITVNHPDSPLDENSVKAFVNEGIEAMLDFGELTTISDYYASSIAISVSHLKENGKRKAVSLYGTDEVPWGRE